MEKKCLNASKCTLTAHCDSVKKRRSRLHYNPNYYQLLGNSATNDILNQNDVRLLACGFFRENNANPWNIGEIVLKYIDDCFSCVKLRVNPQNRLLSSQLMIFDHENESNDNNTCVLAITLTKHDWPSDFRGEGRQKCYFNFGVIGLKKHLDFDKFLSLFQKNQENGLQ